MRRPCWARHPCVQAGLLLALLPSVGHAGHRARFDEASFRQAYREVLVDWAGRGGGLDSLVKLETSAVADKGGERIDAMWRAKLAVLRELIAGERLEVLPAVALLHEQSYLAYLRHSTPALAAHARTMTAELLLYYAEKTPDPEARVLAANILASLAGHVQEASLPSASDALYRHALEIDPENPAALLGRATLLERVGDYGAAVARLRTLVRIEPGSREARLRLAINLSRTGQGSEAEHVLRNLVGAGGRDWIVAVAYQTLAKLLEQRGDASGALGLLMRGAEVLPDEPTLWIQLAFLHDRLGVPAAFDLRASLARAAASSQTSSRSTYLGVSNQALRELRLELRHLNHELSQDLASALRDLARVKETR